MDRLTYLEEHHQLTESIIGLISVQDNIEGVQRILNEWRPKLHKVIVERSKTVCAEGNIPWEDVKGLLSFGKEE